MNKFRIIESYFISGANSKKIFLRVARRETGKAVVILHGACEHSGRYLNLIKFLWKKGYSVFAPDLRGHGRSEGKRVHIGSFFTYFIDLAQLLILVRGENYHRIHLLGHSMGGLIAARYIQDFEQNITSLILSSPLFGWKDMPRTKIFAAKVISKVWPIFLFRYTVDETALSHDPKVAQKYRKDPLVYNGGTARLGAELMENFILLLKNAEEIKLPLLLLAGGADRITDPEASKQFFEEACSENKKCYIFEDMFHEIFNEVEKEKPLKQLAGWLKKMDG